MNQRFSLIITNIISYMINSTYLLNIILPVLTFFAMIYIFMYIFVWNYIK